MPAIADDEETLYDTTTTVREGQSLNQENLRHYLREHFGDFNTLHVKQFPAGYSNLTYLITGDHRSFVLRRPPRGTRAKSANDMGREYRVLKGLESTYPLAPGVLHYCEDNTVLGAPFYLMEHLRGIIVRSDYPAALQMTPETITSQYRQFIAALVGLHTVDYIAAGLNELGKGEGYVERQIGGWRKRHLAALTPNASALSRVTEWLSANTPRDSGKYSLIHNDFKMDNLVWCSKNHQELIGVLDWELATIGDPLMDLGATLGYWVEADDPEDLLNVRNMPSHLPGAPSRRELAEWYAQAVGRTLTTGDFEFYYVYGLFRRAAICQQIYYRYHHGETKDLRFARLPESIAALEAQALRITGGK